MSPVLRDIHIRRKNNNIQVIQVENISNINELLAFAEKITSERIEVPYKGNKIVAFGGMRDGELICIKNPENGELIWPIKQKSNILSITKNDTPTQRVLIVPPKIQNKVEEIKEDKDYTNKTTKDISTPTKHTPDVSDRIRHEIGTEFISVNTISFDDSKLKSINQDPVESELDAIERDFLKLRKDKAENSNESQQKTITSPSKNILKKYTVRVLKNNNVEILNVENEKYSKVLDYFKIQIENGLYDDIIDIYLNKFVWSNKALKERLSAEGII